MAILKYLFVASLLALATLAVLDPSAIPADPSLWAAPLIGLQMTPGQARVIDPILSEIARGYKNADMVGGELFPDVPVDQRGGQIIEFSREDFRLYATGRAPGSNTKRVQYGYLGKLFALKQHALEGVVPFELMQEANAVPGIDLGRVAVNKTQNIIFLSHEKQASDRALDEANYAATNKVTLAGTDQWSDFVNSDPSGDIEDGKEAIRSQIGRRPTTAVIGAAVFAKLGQHPKILDRIKYTSRDVVTTELLAALWGLKRVRVGDAVFMNDAGALVDVWGKKVVLAFTETGPLRDMGLPSYGYTYRLRAHPIVEVPYQDRNAKSWVYPVTDELDPQIAGADAGYLISAAVA
jgi:hypothetical protein